MGSHQKWRAQAKKMRRKRIRQKLAQERDNVALKEQEIKIKCPEYQVRLSEQRALELFAGEEEARISAEQHAVWLAEEERAQKAWRERQERLALARAERAKQELRIKEEWEEEQKKLKAAKEEQDRIAEEKQRKQEDLMRQIENFINKGGDMPPDVNVASVTNPDRPPCPFFTKTGACRFGDRCSRNHTRPAVSRVLLVPNFYDHIGLRQMNPDELEAADDWLEYEDSETYHHYLDFYEDVLPEWEHVGKISQFKVCCNFEPHLRGNVYIEYESAQDAVKAFKMFHGRFYGGKQINVEFVNLDSWKAAICGQFHKHCCPKGRACNFLHVFRNPGNVFRAADRDQQDWRRRQQHARGRSRSRSRGRDRSWSGSPDNSRNRSRERNWRWSASPSPPLDHHSSSLRSRNSTRSFESERDNSPHRKQSSKRKDYYSRDKKSYRSSERAHGPAASNSSRDSWSKKDHDTYNSGSLKKDSNSKNRIKSSDVLTKTVSGVHKKRNAEVRALKKNSDSGCDTKNSTRSENCDTISNLAPKRNVEKDLSSEQIDLPNNHIYLDSSEELNSERNKKQFSREKKSKKRKKKDSHRKEKRRKKEIRSRSVSSNCSNTSGPE